MAYERRTWYQRLGQGLNKFLIGEKDAEGKQELTNAPDSIAQQGDVISAENLNDLEGRIEAGFNGMKLTKLWENTDPSSSFPSQTIALDEIANEIVIEYKGKEGARKFVHVKPDSGGSLSLIEMSTATLQSIVTISLYFREILVYTNDAKTSILFKDGDRIMWGFTSGTGTGDASILTSNGSLVPVAIYKVGDIYNS